MNGPLEQLRALEKRLRSTVFYWGNDLGKVKTEAYEECADELQEVLDRLQKAGLLC